MKNLVEFLRQCSSFNLKLTRQSKEKKESSERASVVSKRGVNAGTLGYALAS